MYFNILYTNKDGGTNFNNHYSSTNLIIHVEHNEITILEL